MKKTQSAHRMWASSALLLHRCQTRACPGPRGCGWMVAFPGVEGLPHTAPMPGEEPNAAEARPLHSTVFTSPHSLSVRWRSMLPLYRGESRLRAAKRFAQSHSQSAERRGQWTRSCLGLFPAQEAAARGFRASPWLGLLPDLDSELRHSCTQCLK